MLDSLAEVAREAQRKPEGHALRTNAGLACSAGQEPVLRSLTMFTALATLTPMLADGTYIYWGGGGLGLIVVIVIIVLLLRR
jgi:hypothetical protein